MINRKTRYEHITVAHGPKTDLIVPSRHNAIAFRSAGKPLGQALIANRGRSVHAAGTLSIDRWNGAERVQLRVTDIAMTEQGVR